MSKPTRDHIKAMQQTLERDGVEYLYPFELKELLTAYLAQEEELKRKDKLIKLQDGFITDKSGLAAERSTQISQLEVELDRLKAENQALKAEREKDIQEAINEYRGDLRS